MLPAPDSSCSIAGAGHCKAHMQHEYFFINVGPDTAPGACRSYCCRRTSRAVFLVFDSKIIPALVRRPTLRSQDANSSYQHAPRASDIHTHTYSLLEARRSTEVILEQAKVAPPRGTLFAGFERMWYVPNDDVQTAPRFPTAGAKRNSRARGT